MNYFHGRSCNKETLVLFSSKFGLSKAETEVLASFSEGLSLKDIAQSRYRSYTTVRNQFQSILEKTDCSNQADLLRTLLGISYLLSYTEIISTEHKVELGKKIEVMRPHGRFVDVRLYGDLKGKPFIALHSLFGIPITEEIEQNLVSRSLLMIGVFRPGFGFTSKPHNKMDLFQCLAEDITAVLDNISVEKCPFIGRASAAHAIFKLSQLIPHRISAACVVNSLIPLPYVTKNKILSKWTMSLVSATRYSPSLATLILSTGKKLMMRNGAKSFLKNMYEKSSSDQVITDDNNVVKSIHQGTLLCSEQGMAAAAQDMLDGFTDWSDDVRHSHLKVSLFQGKTDPHVSIVASRHFANDFPEKIELIEYEGGGLLNYSHTDSILDWITAN
ncbi:MAG TPA: hypothetical protein EYG68_02595 [Leucothrix mucor]|nr:hypothetical protein [Leucothrix mucor]